MSIDRLSRRLSLLAALIAAALMLALALAPPPTVLAEPGDAAPTNEGENDTAVAEAPSRVVVAMADHGWAELVDGQLVVHLAGTGYEMGLAHGRMFPIRVQQVVDAYVNALAIEARGHTLDDLLAMYAEAEPFIPQHMKDEMRGLADGSGVPLEQIQAAHILPTKYHCSGAAAWGPATVDGHLVHYRSLDYNIRIGRDVKIQENAALFVRTRCDGYDDQGKPVGVRHSSIVPAWVGTIGAVTGMGSQGLAIGEKGSSSSKESFAGFPMFFRLRHILEEADDLDEAIEMEREGPRTCGFNFIFSFERDGVARAVAIEEDRESFAVFEGGDEAEDVAPHWPIENCVRRVNHFIDPELAGHQRDEYDPSGGDSFEGYKLISQFLEERMGKLDADAMIELCRLYPPTHSCLHQAVMVPGLCEIYVANAVDPDDEPLAGAQNQPFYRYTREMLLETDPATLPRLDVPDVEDPPTHGPQDVPLPEDEQGVFPLTPLAGEAPEDGELPEAALAFYRDQVAEPLERARFDENGDARGWEYTLEKSGGSGRLLSYRLQFRSLAGGDDPDTANATVHALYTRPAEADDGSIPAIVLLHHLADDQSIESMLANYFGARGYAVLLVYFPYYGPRRAEGDDTRLLSADLDRVEQGVAQAVLDVHAARDWLASRRIIDRDRIGLLGVSLGGTLGVTIAGVDPGFTAGCVFTLAGGDIARIIYNESAETRALAQALTEQGHTEDTVRESLAGLEPLTWAPRVAGAGQRALMLNVEEDEVIPRECTDALAEALGENVTPRYYSGNHSGLVLHLGDLLGRVDTFFKDG